MYTYQHATGGHTSVPSTWNADARFNRVAHRRMGSGLYSPRVSHAQLSDRSPYDARCVAVCCSVLPCVAVCCSMLHCVAVCCSVLQCAAVRCNALHAPQIAAWCQVMVSHDLCVCVRVWSVCSKIKIWVLCNNMSVQIHVSVYIYILIEYMTDRYIYVDI